jgi:hypothetical protein
VGLRGGVRDVLRCPVCPLIEWLRQGLYRKYGGGRRNLGWLGYEVVDEYFAYMLILRYRGIRGSWFRYSMYTFDLRIPVRYELKDASITIYDFQNIL